MSDEPQNTIPEENSAPPSPQEPTPDAPVSLSTSEPVAVPPVAPESPTEAESAVPVNIDNEQISPVELENLAPEQTAQTDNSDSNQPSVEVPEQPTAQMGRNEPLGREVLVKAREAIQNKKRKKLDSILTLFTKQTEITNDEVEKFLHVSDATATRYLSILEKDGKIKQSGRTGRSVSYSKI